MIKVKKIPLKAIITYFISGQVMYIILSTLLNLDDTLGLIMLHSLFFGVVTCLIFLVFVKQLHYGSRNDQLTYENHDIFKVIDEIPCAAYVHDGNAIVFANKSGAKLFGLDKGDLIGKSIMKYIHPDFHEVVKSRINSILLENKDVELIEEKIQWGGREIDVEVSSSLLNVGEEKFIISMLRDITEIKSTEGFLRKMMQQNKQLLNKMIESEKVQYDFFSNITHEFKTPINVILGVVQILNHNSKEKGSVIEYKQLKRYNSMLKQNCYRLLRLINNVIDANKIDSGFLKVDLKNYEIIHIIEDISLSVAQLAENKNISVTFDTEIEEKIMACDPDKIERIMLNLLSNSIKYTEPGGSIEVEVLDKEHSIIILVKDTGVGIPNDKKDKIFTRFGQVGSNMTKANEGSGIGLSLVKSFVDMHDGEIWFESEPGKGTKFFIKLPVKSVPWEVKEENEKYDNNSVERIEIEFSDIYSS